MPGLRERRPGLPHGPTRPGPGNVRRGRAGPGGPGSRAPRRGSGRSGWHCDSVAGAWRRVASRGGGLASLGRFRQTSLTISPPPRAAAGPPGRVVRPGAGAEWHSDCQ